jgi:cytochrome P450
MKFMGMIIDETLRVYPLLLRLERVATSDYEYNEIFIEKGTIFTVPVYAFNRDPNIYEEPEKFNPYRFDHDEIKSNTFNLGFGAGPRNCIGSRFAILEIRLLLARVLSKYKFVPCVDTQIPLVMQKSFETRPVKPIKIKIEKRF